MCVCALCVDTHAPAAHGSSDRVVQRGVWTAVGVAFDGCARRIDLVSSPITPIHLARHALRLFLRGKEVP
jgi:hypothetical protein